MIKDEALYFKLSSPVRGASWTTKAPTRQADVALSRGGDDGGDNGMGVGDLAVVAMVGLGALGTVDVLGGMILGAIECDQQIAIERAKGLQVSELVQRVDNLGSA